MVHNIQNYWVSGLCPSSSIPKAKEHNVSETGSVSVLRWGGRRPLCSVIEVSSFKGPKTVVFPPSPDDGIRSGFRNVCHSPLPWKRPTAQRSTTAINLGFLDRSRYFIEIAPQLSSRGWVGPVPDPLLLRKSGSAGNRTRDLWICSQELWSLDHRGGHRLNYGYHLP
jgi:hypothetical protein